jgi:hypothetical protein
MVVRTHGGFYEPWRICIYRDAMLLEFQSYGTQLVIEDARAK